MSENHSFTDQNGKVVTWQEFICQISESILANLIACHRAGLKPDDIRIVVGKDGGTIIGGGVVFQTPVAHPLTEDEGKDLFAYFKALLRQYEKNELPESLVSSLCEKNRVEHKIESIRKSIGTK